MSSYLPSLLLLLPSFLSRQVRCESTYQSDLKQILTGLVPEKQKEVKEFRQQYGNTPVGEVTVDMVSWKQWREEG